MSELVKMPETYRRGGFDHVLLKRGEHTFMFAVQDEGKIIAFEVFKKLIAKGGMARFGGGPVERFVPPMERKPSNESFGKWAWCCSDEAKALEYFNKLEELEGNLKSFNEYRSPNPAVKIFELHKDGVAISTKVQGVVVNKTVKVTEVTDMVKATKMAKDAFARTLGAAFDIAGYTPVCIGDGFMYGKDQAIEEVNVEEEDSNEE